MSDSEFPEEATVSEVREYAFTPRVLLSTAGLGVGLGVALGMLMTLTLCGMCFLHWQEIRIFGGDADDEEEEQSARMAAANRAQRQSHSASRIVRFIADEDLQKLLEERKTDHDRKILWCSITLLLVTTVTGAIAVFQYALDFQETALEVGLADTARGVSDVAAFLCESAERFDTSERVCSEGSVVAVMDDLNQTVAENLTTVESLAVDLDPFQDEANAISTQIGAALPDVVSYETALLTVESNEAACKAAIEADDPTYDTDGCDLSAFLPGSFYRQRINDVQTSMDSISLGLQDVQQSNEVSVLRAGVSLLIAEFNITTEEVVNEALAQHLRALDFHGDVLTAETESNEFFDRWKYYFLGFLAAPGILYIFGFAFGWRFNSPRPLCLPMSYSYLSIVPLCTIAGIMLLALIMTEDVCEADVHFTLAENSLQDEVYTIRSTTINLADAVRPLARCPGDEQPTDPRNNFVDIFGLVDLLSVDASALNQSILAVEDIAFRVLRESEEASATRASTDIPAANTSNVCDDAATRIQTVGGCLVYAAAVDAAEGFAEDIADQFAVVNGSLLDLSNNLLERSQELDPESVQLLGNLSSNVVQTARDAWRCGFVSSRYQSLFLETYCEDVYATFTGVPAPMLLLCFGSFLAFIVMLCFLPTYIGDTEYRIVQRETRRRKRAERNYAKEFTSGHRQMQLRQRNRR